METLTYFFNDNIGSRICETDENGVIKERKDYTSYGETQDRNSSFTGKERDASGLYYFNARYYDPEVGRFITEDPSQDGDGWYNYCSGDPINRVDPDGRRDIATATLVEEVISPVATPKTNKMIDDVIADHNKPFKGRVSKFVSKAIGTAIL